MLVQALAEYADNYLAEELKDAAWEMKPVPWLLQISRQGTFLNATPRMTTETRCKKQVQVPMQMSVPRSPVARVSGHHPLLGTDFIAYVLGVGPWTLDKTTEREKENNITKRLSLSSAKPLRKPATPRSRRASTSTPIQMKWKRRATHCARQSPERSWLFPWANRWWSAKLCSSTGASITKLHLPDGWRAPTASA